MTQFIEQARDIGTPLLIKAAAGGGKGMHIVSDESDIALGNEFHTVTAHRHGENYTTTIGDNTSLSTRLEHVADENHKVIINGVATPVQLITHGEQTFIAIQ